MRVVSLVPSITETLLAWGVRPVGVTRFCDRPEFPIVGGTTNPDLDEIVALAPDLVVVDEEENRREDHDALCNRGLTVHVTAIRAVADVGPALVRLAAALGVDPPPVVAPVPPVAPVAPVARTAFVPIWRRPWMTINAGTYGASVLASLGWRSAFADRVDRYPTVDLEEVRAAAPEVSLLPTEPYDFGERHRAELEGALGCPALLVDGRDLFWWGVRTPVAMERLRAVLAESAPR